MNVTGVIAIVLKAHAHISRLTSARVRHLVVSDWAARAVLRYWRLQRKCRQAVERLRIRRRHLSITLVGHALVLGLGFVLVVPVLTVRPAATRTVAAQYAGYVLLTTPIRPRNAPIREVLKASALEERPAPDVIVPAAPPARAHAGRPRRLHPTPRVGRRRAGRHLRGVRQQPRPQLGASGCQLR